ncbi:MAG: succinate dehydrogenase/fumarate reductase iron-sulfur subunit [Candidatus Micrarchaeaceae archaeon]
MAETKIKLYRCDPSTGEDGHWVEYTVEKKEGAVVLDAVNYINHNIDPSLAVRWNCKAARCGSCAAEINGVPRLMCKTRIDGLGDNISVGPMRAFPLIKDLVTDVSSNYEIEKRITPFTPKKAEEPWVINEIDVTRSQEFRKCIECFLCMDVCHVIRDHSTNYIGPRHVVKVASLDMHPMDAVDRSKELKESSGLGYCDVTKCCQEVCPEHIKITDNAIIPEKERAADKFYDPIISGIMKLRHGKNSKEGKENGSEQASK